MKQVRRANQKSSQHIDPENIITRIRFSHFSGKDKLTKDKMRFPPKKIPTNKPIVEVKQLKSVRSLMARMASKLNCKKSVKRQHMRTRKTCLTLKIQKCVRDSSLCSSFLSSSKTKIRREVKNSTSYKVKKTPKQPNGPRRKTPTTTPKVLPE